MQWNSIIAALGFGAVVAGQSENDIVLENHTGLPIVRILIGERRLEDGGGIGSGKILVSVSPHRHHLEVVFRGGADVQWPHFDFKGVHAIIFERHNNKIDARIE